MTWEVDFTDAFGEWWATLTSDERESVNAGVLLIRARGPHLGFPHSSAVRGGRNSRIRELRIQHRGRPFRVLYAFDPRRHAVLLVGGDKALDGRFYERMLSVAERVYDEHLEDLRKRGITG